MRLVGNLCFLKMFFNFTRSVFLTFLFLPVPDCKLDCAFELIVFTASLKCSRADSLKFLPLIASFAIFDAVLTASVPTNSAPF
jgi:hypothetical protein